MLRAAGRVRRTFHRNYSTAPLVGQPWIRGAPGSPLCRECCTRPAYERGLSKLASRRTETRQKAKEQLAATRAGSLHSRRIQTGGWRVTRDVTWILSSWKSLSRGASLERLWGISERASVRLVFLFFGGFLLGCHEVFPPFERFVLPRFSTGHLDARATQLVV